MSRCGQFPRTFSNSLFHLGFCRAPFQRLFSSVFGRALFQTKVRFGEDAETHTRDGRTPQKQKNAPPESPAGRFEVMNRNSFRITEDL